MVKILENVFFPENYQYYEASYQKYEDLVARSQEISKNWLFWLYGKSYAEKDMCREIHASCREIHANIWWEIHNKFVVET